MRVAGLEKVGSTGEWGTGGGGGEERTRRAGGGVDSDVIGLGI